jgi:exopolysaccharide biosynthesis polyprenyl glycosylphosphotransferase
MQQRALITLDTEPGNAGATAFPNTTYEIVKRAFDVVVAALALLALLPLLIVVAVLVRTTSPGSAIFRQTRCGRYGRPFTCFKFRTMEDGAEHRKSELMDRNEMTGPVFKINNDPRVTPLGRWLRKMSIDELPQLVNVLRGEMSLVGPRPPLPEEVEQYTPLQRRRLMVKPGLTCLWQVSGRNKIGFDEWVNLDLQYIERRSFWFDLWLLVLTVPAVISGRGAA